ncbi:MAG: flagellar hook-associated protein FlgL [Thermoleophilaceae bacterium]
MSTRITNLMTQRGVLSDLSDVANRLSQTQRKMSSGKDLTKPSDDPFRANRAMTIRSDLEGIAQYKRNIGEAQAWQSATDTSLGNMTDITQRVRELVLQGSNDTLGPTERGALASEVDQLADALKQESNSQYAGRYIFAGTADQTQPYTQNGVDTYAGNGAAIARSIGPTVSLQVNVTGNQILGSGQPTPPATGDGLLLNTLRDISQHLRGGTTADINALRTTDLQDLDKNLDNLASVRATVGATTNRLETAQNRFEQVEGTATQQLSETEDADMAKVLTDFSMQQSVYQAALKSGANIVQASLLDFLT